VISIRFVIKMEITSHRLIINSDGCDLRKSKTYDAIKVSVM